MASIPMAEKKKDGVFAGAFFFSVSWGANGRTPPGRVSKESMTPSADEVSVVSERSREQKDAEGRKSAIDLEVGAVETPRKRTDVETRVAKARSLCSTEVDARARELMEEHYKEFIAERIDGAELERRRAAARDQAAKEHPPLSALETAFAAYTAAAAAEQAAEARREAAEATLEAALRALEKKGEAGPSGVREGDKAARIAVYPQEAANDRIVLTEDELVRREMEVAREDEKREEERERGRRERREREPSVAGAWRGWSA